MIASAIGFFVAVAYLKLRLPTTTKRAQTLRQYNTEARARLLELRPFLTLEPAAQAPLSTLDEQTLAISLEINPLLQHLDAFLLPELQEVWQVAIESRLLIPFKVIERITTLEAARKKIDKSYQLYVDDRVKLDYLVELQQKYSRFQQLIDNDLERQRVLIDGALMRLETLRQAGMQTFYDVELQIERLSDSLREAEALFNFAPLDEQPAGVEQFRHAFDLMYSRLLHLDDVLPTLNYRLHQLTRAQRYLLREQARLADLDTTIQQQLIKAEAREVEVADLWEKYQAAQVNLVRARQIFRTRSTETFISMAGSLTRIGDANDTRLDLISAELRNILSETRTRISTTVQLERLYESIQLLGDLHEELRGLAQIDTHPQYEAYLATVTDLSLEFERRREALESKQRRNQTEINDLRHIVE